MSVVKAPPRRQQIHNLSAAAVVQQPEVATVIGCPEDPTDRLHDSLHGGHQVCTAVASAEQRVDPLLDLVLSHRDKWQAQCRNEGPDEPRLWQVNALGEDPAEDCEAESLNFGLEPRQEPGSIGRSHATLVPPPRDLGPALCQQPRCSLQAPKAADERDLVARCLVELTCDYRDQLIKRGLPVVEAGRDAVSNPESQMIRRKRGLHVDPDRGWRPERLIQTGNGQSPLPAE